MKQRPKGVNFCVNQRIKNRNFKIFCYSNPEIIISLVNAYGVVYLSPGRGQRSIVSSVQQLLATRLTVCKLLHQSDRHIAQGRNTQYLIL
jgi:hypothetical protein